MSEWVSDLGMSTCTIPCSCVCVLLGVNWAFLVSVFLPVSVALGLPCRISLCTVDQVC